MLHHFLYHIKEAHDKTLVFNKRLSKNIGLIKTQIIPKDQLEEELLGKFSGKCPVCDVTISTLDEAGAHILALVRNHPAPFLTTPLFRIESFVEKEGIYSCTLCHQYQTSRSDWFKLGREVLQVQGLFHLLRHVGEAHRGLLVIKSKDRLSSRNDQCSIPSSEKKVNSLLSQEAMKLFQASVAKSSTDTGHCQGPCYRPITRKSSHHSKQRLKVLWLTRESNV